MCFAMVINAMKAVQGVEGCSFHPLTSGSSFSWGWEHFPTSTQLILASSSTSSTLPVPDTLHFPKRGVGCGGDEQQLHKRCT